MTNKNVSREYTNHIGFACQANDYTPRQRASFVSHIENCAECTKFVDWLIKKENCLFDEIVDGMLGSEKHN